MNKKEIREFLNSRYERDKWKKFTSKIFKNVNYFSSPIKIESNNNKIVSFYELGFIKLVDGKKISLFELKLRKDLNIQRNKVELRNITTKFIDMVTSHGVLVIYENQSDDYRLTFSSKYEEILETGEFKKIETDNKRFTYLLGENESCSTAAERISLLSENSNSLNLNDLFDAFNVDKVNQEFFNNYKNLCFKLVEQIKVLRSKDKRIDNDFKNNFLDEYEFSKKLMGQIVFLYFIQKKGWLGLKRKDDGTFPEWGKGPKNFLRKLFDKEYCNYKNFFNDVLEELFYVGLSTDLPNNYFPKLQCKIPYLNGGLFEPLNNYDWNETNLYIENKIIEEIFDIFDRYNFTIEEEDNFEKEIAIDPEMLGKVFENLLDENLQKGVRYTPREIVNLMCINSLAGYFEIYFQKEFSLNFLKTTFNDLSKYEMIQSDGLNKDINNFLNKYANKLDNKLAKIKICDPAIGSGAFPVTMMNIVTKIRKNCKYFLNKNIHNTMYGLKKSFIKNNIYGVDIDSSAVEISKLRLWLSLIIDEDNLEKIDTLPTLDYKILQGNSLFDDFGSIDLFSNSQKQLSFDSLDSEKEILLEKYSEELKKFNEVQGYKNKNFQKEKINNLLKSIINEEIESKKKFDSRDPKIIELKDLLEDFEKKKHDFFLWRIVFFDVFKNNKGFDIVIANPPYLRQEEIIPYKKRIEDTYKLYNSTSDIYTYFYELSKSILNDEGCSSFITSNKWMRAKYGLKLRKFFLEDVNLIDIVNFTDLKIFQNATTNTNLTLFSKDNTRLNNLTYCEFSKKDNVISDLDYVISNSYEVNRNSLNIENFSFNDVSNNNLLNKIISKGVQFKDLNAKIYYGLKTGFNEGFVIDGILREKLIKKCPLAKELIKPILRGRDISKYNFNFNDKWLICIPSGWTNKNKGKLDPLNYVKKNINPIIEHLISIENIQKKNRVGSKRKLKGLFNRDDFGDYWWELRDCIYYDTYDNKNKIVWLELTDESKFSLCSEPMYLLAGAFHMIVEEPELIIGYLNSSVAMYNFKHIGNSSGTSTSQWKKFAINKLIVPQNINIKIKEKIIKLVNNIYSKKINYEKAIIDIDNIFFDIFELSEKEIALINNSV